MTCLEFLDRLDGLLAGRCAPDAREEAERHAAGCASCGALLQEMRQVPGDAAAGAGNDPLDESQSEDLVAAVLRRTSGASACRRAEEIMSEHGVPGARSGAATPEALDLRLLAAHLEHCDPCASLAASLRLAANVLPSLAEMDPGAGFTSRVLRATSRRPAESLPGGALGWWRRWLARPRFAVELAYVATLLLVIIVGNPIAPLQAASERTATMAAAGFERARNAWPAVAPKVGVPEQVRVLRAVTSEALSARPGLRDALGIILDRSASWWASAWSWVEGRTFDLMGTLQAGWRRLQATAAAAPEKPAAGGGEPPKGRAR